jgi:hypothetical protein
MMFREFYTGSTTDLTPEERAIMEALFTTQFYVEREIEYSYTSTMGSVNETALRNWPAYLNKYYPYIVSGTHFTNFAVQVLILLLLYKCVYNYHYINDYNGFVQKHFQRHAILDKVIRSTTATC